MNKPTFRIGSPSAYAGLPCHLVREERGKLVVRIDCPGSTQHDKTVTIGRHSPGVYLSSGTGPASLASGTTDYLGRAEG